MKIGWLVCLPGDRRVVRKAPDLVVRRAPVSSTRLQKSTQLINVFACIHCIRNCRMCPLVAHLEIELPSFVRKNNFVFEFVRYLQNSEKTGRKNQSKICCGKSRKAETWKSRP